MMSKESIYSELLRLTHNMCNNGWRWSGAAKLEKNSSFFAMTKNVVVYVEDLKAWYGRETQIVFDFKYDEPIQIFDKERKLIPTSNLRNTPYVAGLSAEDICIIAQIINVGRKMKELP